MEKDCTWKTTWYYKLIYCTMGTVTRLSFIFFLVLVFF